MADEDITMKIHNIGDLRKTALKFFSSIFCFVIYKLSLELQFAVEKPLSFKYHT